MRKPLVYGLLGGGVLLIGLLLFGPGAMKAVGAEPASCAACHSMEKNVSSFHSTASKHKDTVSCSDCHLPAGAVEGLLAKYSTGFRHVVTTVAGDAPDEIRLRPVDREMLIANCARCHGEEDHSKQNGKSSCLNCHSNDPHGERGL